MWLSWSHFSFLFISHLHLEIINSCWSCISLSSTWGQTLQHRDSIFIFLIHLLGKKVLSFPCVAGNMVLGMQWWELRSTDVQIVTSRGSFSRPLLHIHAPPSFPAWWRSSLSLPQNHPKGLLNAHCWAPVLEFLILAWAPRCSSLTSSPGKLMLWVRGPHLKHHFSPMTFALLLKYQSGLHLQGLSHLCSALPPHFLTSSKRPTLSILVNTAFSSQHSVSHSSALFPS